ncbi:MAG TPA: DUF5666 domain-containing protein [Anaeromyxobacteraceae bacterium]|nr:DUF5666 domain-containing protein [Anaeromyxobacteraceae bacterium]
MRHTILALPLAALVALAACSDSSSSSNNGTGGTTGAKVSQGVVTARTTSAVTVNGQNFATTSSTTVRIDDNPSSADQLQPGMVVKVNVDDHGNATSIDSKAELRGRVDDNGSTTINVGGQLVRVDDSTHFDDNGGQAGKPVGTQVRVHGFPDDKGGLRASRVERDRSSVFEFEIHGFASGLSASGFTLTVSKASGAPTFTVQYGTGVSAPAGLAEGSFVEVKSASQPAGGTIVASSVKLDDNRLGEQGEAEIEGFVTSGTSASFVIDGVTVTTTSSTKWVGGGPADLIPGVKVEAEGHLDSSGNLAATKVSFRDGYRLQGAAGPSPATGTSGTFTVVGRTVQVTDATEFDDGLTLANLGTENVQVRGYPAADGKGLVALRIKCGTGGGGGGGGGTSRCNSSRTFVQAPVTSASDPTIVMFGFTVNTAGASLQDRNGAPMTRSDFFAFLNANANSVVKARASSAVTNDAFTSDEVELEDDH